MMTEEQVYIAYRKRQDNRTLLDDTDGKFTLIENSKRYSYSSPFLFDFRGNTYIFACCFDKLFCRKNIAYCKLNDNGIGPWRIVLKKPYDISYPHIFEFRGNIYMIPDSEQIDDMMLYKADSFPDVWIPIKTLSARYVYIASTFYEFKGRHYILTYNKTDNISENFLSGSLAELLPPIPYKKLERPTNNTKTGKVIFRERLTYGMIEDRFKNKKVNSELFAISPFPVNKHSPSHGISAGAFFRYKDNLVRPVRCNDRLEFFNITDVTPASFNEIRLFTLTADLIKTDGENISFDAVNSYSISEKFELLCLTDHTRPPRPLIMRICSRILRIVSLIWDFPFGDKLDKQIRKRTAVQRAFIYGEHY